MEPRMRDRITSHLNDTPHTREEEGESGGKSVRFISGAGSKRWGRVREEYVGKSKVLVNDVSSENAGNRDGTKSDFVSFFNVVKEASAVEKKKKERPTLLKFLQKFDSVDLPESVTPNASQGFSHFESNEDTEDEDTKLLRNSLLKVSGKCIELSTPTFQVHQQFFSNIYNFTIR